MTNPQELTANLELSPLAARVVELEATLAVEKARNAKLQDWQNEYQEACDIIRRSAKLLDEAGGTPYLVAKAEVSEARATALLEALRTAIKVANEAREEWDKAPSGMKAGKLLIALSDPSLKYRADITAMHAAINAGASNDRK